MKDSSRAPIWYVGKTKGQLGQNGQNVLPNSLRHINRNQTEQKGRRHTQDRYTGTALPAKNRFFASLIPNTYTPICVCVEVYKNAHSGVQQSDNLSIRSPHALVTVLSLFSSSSFLKRALRFKSHCWQPGGYAMDRQASSILRLDFGLRSDSNCGYILRCMQRQGSDRETLKLFLLSFRSSHIAGSGQNA